ncbi:MAG: peptide chain release factor N(5)-glutamine methyltransferase [Armatimonadetes bacterium]|nr:peptide chain release factor N(5)-glutamine methyltransferase [Armatimonadota bacterium]
MSGLPEGTASRAVAAATSRLAAAGCERARAEAEILVRWATGLTREQLVVHPETLLTPKASSQFEEGVSRREKREPLPYIVGEAEFYSLPFHVSPAVLVPRPETEHLLEEAVARANTIGARTAADVGTGSGILATLLAREFPALRVVATDVSGAALTIAHRNAQRHRVRSRVHFVCCDLLRAVRWPLDCIVANPPYIRRDEFEGLEPEVRDYEPRLALNGGADGLGIIQRLTPGLGDHLNKGGFAALEVGAGQAEAVAKLLASNGLSNVEVLSDYAGIARIVIGWHEG